MSTTTIKDVRLTDEEQRIVRERVWFDALGENMGRAGTLDEVEAICQEALHWVAIGRACDRGTLPAEHVALVSRSLRDLRDDLLIDLPREADHKQRFLAGDKDYGWDNMSVEETVAAYDAEAARHAADLAACDAFLARAGVTA